jgi:hypothetical protein
MKKEDIKRFMPASILAVFLSIIVCDIGVGKGYWHFRETTYPLALLSTYVYGLFPIVSIWILKFTYEQFWLYFVAEVVVNIIFAYLFLPWFARRGIIDYNAGLIVLIAATLISLIVYCFQMWQEAPVRK